LAVDSPESASKFGRFEGETAAQVQQIADANVAKSLRILYHIGLSKVLTRGGATPSFRQDISTSAITQSPRFCPWAGTRADETKRSKGAAPAAVGRVGFDASGPTGKDSLRFFYELEDDESPLLDFQARGQDKWRIIHAWLLDAQRLSDYWISPMPRVPPTRKPRPARHKSGAKM
jgi:hypothetical protein